MIANLYNTHWGDIRSSVVFLHLFIGFGNHTRSRFGLGVGIVDAMVTLVASGSQLIRHSTDICTAAQASDNMTSISQLR